MAQITSHIKNMLSSINSNATQVSSAQSAYNGTTVVGNLTGAAQALLPNQTTTFINPGVGMTPNYQINFDFDDQNDSMLLGLPETRQRGDWRHRHPEECKKFSGTEFNFEGDLFGTNFSIKNAIMEFHFHTWRLTHEHVQDYGVMSNMSDREEKLWFSSQKSRNDFRTWFARYEQLFPNKFLARWRVSPFIAGRQTVTLVERKASADEDQLCVLWAWLLTNCAGRASFLPGFLAFENDNDAVGYRLRWG